MTPRRTSPRAFWIGTGIALAAVLHAGVATMAQSSETYTNSTTSSTSVESPPACTVIGSSRQEVTATVQIQIGPSCIGIGNRDIANPTPSCSPPFGDPDPFHGTTSLVLVGTTNFNTNVHTETITCVAAVPALPLPALFALGGLLTGAGAWWIRRRRWSPDL